MNRWLICGAVVLGFWLTTNEASAIGRGGGGGGLRGGVGGAGFSGGGRPQFSGARPQFSGARPQFSGARPQFSGGRPNISVPDFGGTRPTVGRPTIRQTPTYARPTTRPTTPSFPSGGLVPSTRPGVSRPATRPPLPDTVTRPNISVPSLGGRPSTLPSTRPDLSRPATRPDIARPDIARPGMRPGAGRPSVGDLNDFLGIQRPSTLPAPTRPGIADRPGIPGIADRPGIDHRPINISNRPIQVDRSIHNRPTWTNISPTRITQINRTWNTAAFNPARPGMNNWLGLHPARHAFWTGWAVGVRHGWAAAFPGRNWFDGIWWNNHYPRFGGWHYWRRLPYHPYSYWWRRPVWPALTTWFVWVNTAPTVVWQQPIFYDYGSGGNVVFQNNIVYINGEQVCSTAEFAQSAAELATVAPPENDQQAEQAEWMPLGTFALSTSEHDTAPARVVQLAVDRQGVISGTMYNAATEQTTAIQGQVDKQTQRVAMRFGSTEQVVAETGLYNLTQDEAPLLVHFADQRTEIWNLVRLDPPEGEDAPAADQPPALP